MLTLIQSRFPSWPIVARHLLFTRRISPDGRMMTEYSPSFAPRRATPPAERTSFPPCPGFISMLWISRPDGMLLSGRQFPTSGSDCGPLVTFVPTFSPLGARMYDFSPSSYWISAMKQDRLGSYSI